MNASYHSRWKPGVAVALVLAACTAPVMVLPSPTAETVVPPAASAVLPNPASAYCEEQGYRLEIRTAPDGSQSGTCIFPDGSECDEWNFYRGECGSAIVTPVPSSAANTASVTHASAIALPTLEGGYAGWQRYAQTAYDFEFRYPPDWAVVPDDNPVSTLYGHALFVQPSGEGTQVQLRVVFRHMGDDVLLWPTGVGEGEFMERDTVAFMGGWLRRVALVCQGNDMAVWYRDLEGGEIRRDKLEFSFILARLGSCTDGEGLSPDQQVIANMIIASLKAGAAGAAR